MINPLRSEAEAFRFLIASIVYFGAIVIAAVAGGKWAGIIVFIVLSTAVVAWWLHARREEKPIQTRPRPHAEGERRILVIANETVGGHTLRSMILEKSLDVREEVLVVTPALNSPLKTWVSDEDGARAAAQERLDDSLAKLADAGVQARVRSGTATRCRRSKTHSVRSARTRSSSRRIRRDGRTGSSAESSKTPASASPYRSHMSW